MRNSTGAKAQLSFGTVPLGPDVYRLEIGRAIVQMAGNANNKSGLTGAKVLSFANSYIANTDPIFNNVVPASFAIPTVAITSPATSAWARKTISVISTSTSPFGLKTIEFLVNGTPVATSATGAPAMFTLDTTAYADGAYALAVRSTDQGGFVTTGNIQLNVDNTAPTTTVTASGSYIYIPLFSAIWAGTATDAGGSGLFKAAQLTAPFQTSTTIFSASGAWTMGAVGVPNGYAPVVRLTDNVGNCNDYAAGAVVPTQVLLTANACP